MKFNSIHAALLLAAFSFSAEASDFINVIDNVSKAIDTIQDLGVRSVQASTGFEAGAATGIASAFPTGTKTIYISYVAVGSSVFSTPIQANWHQLKDGQYGKFYTHNSTMPKAGVTDKFVLSRQDGTAWPAGDYRVDLVVQSKVAGSVSFSVSSAASSSSNGNTGVWGSSSTATPAATSSAATATTAATTTAAAVTTATATTAAATSTAAPVSSSPGIKDIQISSGFSAGKATGAASSFSQSTKTIYASYTATGQSTGVKVQSVWYQEKENTLVKIKTLNSTLPATGVSKEFSLSSSGDSWPAGNYRVEFLINGAIAGAAPFTIENSNSGVWQPAN